MLCKYLSERIQLKPIFRNTSLKSIHTGAQLIVVYKASRGHVLMEQGYAQPQLMTYHGSSSSIRVTRTGEDCCAEAQDLEDDVVPIINFHH